jgi:hypothetical protein
MKKRKMKKKYLQGVYKLNVVREDFPVSRSLAFLPPADYRMTITIFTKDTTLFTVEAYESSK